MKTIAELRRQEAVKLAHFKNPQPTDKDIADAVSLMNAFYRLCGGLDRLSYLENDERTYNRASTRYLREQVSQRGDKLQRRFAEYGLVMTFCGHLPSIGVCDANGAFTEKINRYFYR